ncbi:MAG: 30S ribosomal protein S6 [Chloroflexota bacterium]
MESGLPEYELVVIVSPASGEEALEARVEAVSKLITGRGGTVVNVERWGKRKLAYPVKHSREGLYFLVRFKAGTQLGKELDTSLRISEDVLRHMLVRLENHKASAKGAKRKPLAKEAESKSSVKVAD